MIPRDRIDAAAGQATLVLVVEAKGSTPAADGSAMLVFEDRIEGTIGGGAVEFEAIRLAREGLDLAERIFPLGPEIDQCCGGHMRLAFARVPRDPEVGHGPTLQEFTLWPGGPALRPVPHPRQVIVYGAGHVGRALIEALAPLPFRVLWVDARSGVIRDVPAGVEKVETPLPESVAIEADPDALHVVLTHSHAVDLEVVSAVLPRPHGFCGLIGSATKRAVFERRLAERGIPADGLTCPIGLDGLHDKRPAVIAASVTAQLLQVDAMAEAGPC